ncbi:MAG TPA: SGNH/GDSL hydrolase family protein [Accumulibacter sp.]|uniref:SGNH/GDSL hydrolase family protein n=1 Tax=Accumulibacter sp. TaxID=2053492 RepID=UPI002CD491E2|nr:SGNH/GDSL hydrolase family protein [Accumulibacter sp.]HMV04640.1 SGNH/GDSL hydrolase family protein [Accumulibacter sp.]HMW64519.1 SGNH/GDSL hydrolase family protein [Accumulibacter sp.]HMW81257.1 SGNH/GDSL hydrolase family protein [Accumulibacter sp.]HNB68498.1 SGNH/GDSL hydrolase family protein [Accumulibacter sp.]HNC27137.1 SGNH/GDSL hydrolase family protein [Accumulibacter sp.]
MKSLRFLFALLVAVVCPVPSSATELVVFGDSLSDVGNVYADSISRGLLPDPPSPPYYNGRMSNGPIWVDYLADGIGSARPQASQAVAGATGYAYAGSAIGPGERVRSSIVYTSPPPGQQQLVSNSGKQINDFLAAAPGNNLTAEQLVLFWSGSQNLLQATLTGSAQSGLASIAATLNELQAELRLLSAHGARRIVVPNQIDASSAPFFNGYGPNLPAGTKPLLSFLTGEFNTRLAALLAALSADPTFGARLYPVYVDEAFDLIQADPLAYGFDNLTVPLALARNPVNPSGYLFWDPIHPTTQGHEIIARNALRALPLPGSLSLILLGLAVFAGQRVRRN